MPIVVVDQETNAGSPRMRGAIVGQYKVGKSWLLATGRPLVLIADIDQRAESLARKKGVITWTPYDPPGLSMQPTIYNEVLNLVAALEKSRRLGDVLPEHNNHPRSNDKIMTVGLDSAQSMSRNILKYNMYTNPGELARKIKIGGQSLLFPSGWDTWNSDMECFEQLIGRMVAIPEIDFFVTFHETDENGKVHVYPGRHQPIVRYFNEQWRLTRIQNIPDLQLAPTYNFTACTTLVNPPGVVHDPNIQDLIAKYGKK